VRDYVINYQKLLGAQFFSRCRGTPQALLLLMEFICFLLGIN
jgi:hypothetical protein